MKAKIKQGHDLLFKQGASNDWSKLKDRMIINFIDKWTFLSFKQKRNHLLIHTTGGLVDIVFTGEPPRLTFEYYDKNQLILSIDT